MKKLTKSFLTSVALLSALTLSNTMTAEAASWKLVDSKNVSASATAKNTYLNGVIGSKAKVCLKDQFGGMRLSVYDNDDKFGPLILNSVFVGNNGCTTAFNATPYIDGTDKDAEFIVQPTRGSVSAYTLELWDYR